MDECPKLQAVSPLLSNHSLYCKDINLRIHFDLNRTFSSFHMRKSLLNKLASCNDISVTPDSATWSPYSEDVYCNEQAMFDSDSILASLAHPGYKQQ